MKVLEGNRAHMAHLQYHAYGGDDWHTMRSEAATIAEYFNAHPNLTTDAGAVLFGNTVTITADGPWQHLLYKLTGRKWGNIDVENETGCGIVPYVYKEKNLVNAVQWAVGLELLLLINDPWRIYLTTDHPNGAAFWRYPEIIQLLMDARLPPRAAEEAAAQGARSGSSCRSWTASTRCPRSPSSPRPARRGRSGLPQKGHLGVGADADVAIYNESTDGDRMFRYPRYVIKGGEVVIEEGEIRKIDRGHGSSSCSPPTTRRSRTIIRPLFQQYYTMSFDNYPVEMERDRTPGDPARASQPS